MGSAVKDKAAELDAELRDLRSERNEKAAKREKAKEAWAAVPSGADRSEAFGEVQKWVKDVGELDDQIAALGHEQETILKSMDKEEGGKPSFHTDGNEDQWNARALFEDPELREQLEFLASTKARFGGMEIGKVVGRDTFAAEIMAAEPTLVPRQREGAYRGVLPQVFRPLRLLDLIPTGTTDGNSVPYTRESGTFGGPAETAEGTAKPQLDGWTYTDEDAPVRTIAAYIKLKKQALADFAALRSITDTRLRYAVQRRVEGQVLAGDGTGENLEGILETSGIGLVEYSSTVPVSELILSGITNVYLNDGQADGIAMNPVDWNLALTEKAHSPNGSAGSYEYQGGGPFGSTPQTMWGVSCVPVPVLAQGQSLVADFALGAQLLIREGVNVLLSDSDQDDFIKNRVTMLGETRAALLIWRPGVFQEVETRA